MNSHRSTKSPIASLPLPTWLRSTQFRADPHVGANSHSSVIAVLFLRSITDRRDHDPQSIVALAIDFRSFRIMTPPT